MIRAEQPEDREAIHQLTGIAFGRPSAADLGDRRRGRPNTLSLVAVVAESLVGHVFFSPDRRGLGRYRPEFADCE